MVSATRSNPKRTAAFSLVRTGEYTESTLSLNAATGCCIAWNPRLFFLLKCPNLFSKEKRWFLLNRSHPSKESHWDLDPRDYQWEHNLHPAPPVGTGLERSIWRSRKNKKHWPIFIYQQSSKRRFIPGNSPGHFHIFPQWLFMMSLNIWHYPHGSTGPILFGTQTPFSWLPLRLQEVHNDTTFLLQKCTHPLWPEQSGQNSNLLPHCLSLSLQTCGVSCILSKNGVGGLHDVFQNWIRTKKCLKNSTFRGSLFEWLQKNDYMTSPLLGRRQQIDPEVDEHRWVCSSWRFEMVNWSTGQLLTEGP